MNPNWPQQETFCEYVTRFGQKNGFVNSRGSLNITDLADTFGIAASTLKQFLQNKKRLRPHYDTLSDIAAIVGCSVTEFMDDPGTSPTGTHLDQWIEASERDRMIASAMFHDITADELSEDEKNELYLAYKEARERIIRLRHNQPQGAG